MRVQQPETLAERMKRLAGMPSPTEHGNDEGDFRKWYAGWATKTGIDADPDDPRHKYDYRAAFRSSAVPEIDKTDGKFHWPSRFKADDHPNRFVNGIDTKRDAGETLAERMARLSTASESAPEPRVGEHIRRAAEDLLKPGGTLQWSTAKSEPAPERPSILDRISAQLRGTGASVASRATAWGGGLETAEGKLLERIPGKNVVSRSVRDLGRRIREEGEGLKARSSEITEAFRGRAGELAPENFEAGFVGTTLPLEFGKYAALGGAGGMGLSALESAGAEPEESSVGLLSRGAKAVGLDRASKALEEQSQSPLLRAMGDALFNLGGDVAIRGAAAAAPHVARGARATGEKALDVAAKATPDYGEGMVESGAKGAREGVNREVRDLNQAIKREPRMGPLRRLADAHAAFSELPDISEPAGKLWWERHAPGERALHPGPPAGVPTEGTAVAGPAIPLPRSTGPSSRTPSGQRRPVEKVSDTGLVDELLDLEPKMEDAAGRAQYKRTIDEGFHMTNDGGPVFLADRSVSRVSQQAKALQNLDDYYRIHGEVTEELKRRGWTDDQIINTIDEQRASREAVKAAEAERDANEYLETVYGITPARPEKPEQLTRFDTPAIIAERKRATAFEPTTNIRTPEREQLRTELVNRMYGQGSRDKSRQAWIILGYPGSGKSTVADPIVQRTGAVLLDNDPIKAVLAEHDFATTGQRPPEAAVHLESSNIKLAALRRAIENGDDFVLPQVGDPRDTQRIIDNLAKHGYRVHITHVVVPQEVAAQRAVARFEEGGHLVDPDYIVNRVGSRPVDTYEVVKQHPAVETYEAIDNDVPRGQPGRPLESGSRANEAGNDNRPGEVRGGVGGERVTGADGGDGRPRDAAEGQLDEETLAERMERLAMQDEHLLDANPNDTFIDPETGRSLFGNPVVPALRESARMAQQNPRTAGAVIGGTVGAAEDDENRLGGAAAGAAAGALLGHAARRGGRIGLTIDDVSKFYSRLERAIQTAPFEKGTAAQWNALLSKNVAKGEREWTKIDDSLWEKFEGGTIPKDYLLEQFRTNRIQLTESVAGGAPPEAITAAQRLDAARGLEGRAYQTLQRGYARGDLAHTVADILADPQIAATLPEPYRRAAHDLAFADSEIAATRELASQSRPSAKFAEYTEPGGENYREIKIQLGEPQKDLPKGYALERNPSPAAETQGTQWIVTGPSSNIAGGRYGSGKTPDAALAAFWEHHGKHLGKPQFTSGHFDEPNILVHARVKDRTLPNGEKVLFVEEIQSDWHQKGRRGGYRRPDAERDRLEARLDEIRRELTDLSRRPADEYLLTGRTLPGYRAGQREQELWAEQGRIEASLNARGPAGAVPDAPFKKTEEWVGLAMKRLIDEAVEGGYGRIAWTTGDQQAARYDLSKKVDRIVYEPESGDFLAEFNGQTVHEGRYDSKALDDVIGKEVADRLRKAPPSDQFGNRELTGLDLRVGGDGMKAFYDQMLPKWVKEYGKKMGVKIELETLGGARDMPTDQVTFNESEEITTSKKLAANQSIRIAPLAGKVKREGQPLYSTPIGPALKNVAESRATTTAALTTLGVLLEAEDDERLQATGNGVLALAALHAVGMPRMRGLARKGGAEIVDVLKQKPVGVKTLNWISHDILAAPEVKTAVKEYRQAAAYGSARATELASKLRELGPVNDRIVSDIIEGESFAGGRRALKKADARAVLAVMKEVNDEFTALGQAKAGAGILSLKTVAKRQGKYLPRFYAEHLANQAEQGVSEFAESGKRIRIKGEKQRQTLTDQMRNQLGEVREASFRTQRGVDKGYRDVAAAKLFDALSTLPGVFEPTFAQRTGDLRAAIAKGDKQAIKLARMRLDKLRGGHKDGEFVRMPNTPGMGVLKGAIVRRDVAEYLNGVPELSNAWGSLMGTWKKIHVVYNPGTHIGNFLSNISLAHMAGLPVHEQPVALTKAASQLRRYGPNAKYLAEAGVLNHNLASSPSDELVRSGADPKRALEELASTTRPETKAVIAKHGITAPGPVRRALRAADAGASRLYANGDNIFRLALFEKAMAPVAKGGLGLNKQQAAEYARYKIVNYETRSPALGVVRNYLSPFVLFPAKALPMVISSVVEHPWRYLTLAAAWAGLDQYSRAAVGPVNERDLRPDQRASKLGYVMPGPIQLPTKGDRGEKMMFDVARFTPMSGLVSGSPPGATTTAISPDWPQAFTPSGPLFDLAARFGFNTEPFTGDEWIGPADSKTDVAKKVGGAAAGMVLPTALAFHLPRVVSDLRNADTKAARTDALGFVGARPQIVIPGLQSAKEQKELNAAIAAIELETRRKLIRNRDPRRAEQIAVDAGRRVQQLVDNFNRKQRPNEVANR